MADAFRAGWSRERIEELLVHRSRGSSRRSRRSSSKKRRVREGGVASLETDRLRELKRRGFSDSRLGTLTGTSEDTIRAKRHALNIRPVYKRVDTCAAEFCHVHRPIYIRPTKKSARRCPPTSARS